MYALLFIAFGCFCCAIAFQDFKSRLINVYLLVGFGICNICLFFTDGSIHTFIQNLLFCVTYLLILYGVVWLYFVLKTGGREKIIDVKIGWADIWLLLLVGCCLEPVHLVYFLTLAFSISLVFHFVFMTKHRTIPLAAYLAILSVCDKVIYVFFDWAQT